MRGAHSHRPEWPQQGGKVPPYPIYLGYDTCACTRSAECLHKPMASSHVHARQHNCQCMYMPSHLLIVIFFTIPRQVGACALRHACCLHTHFRCIQTYVYARCYLPRLHACDEVFLCASTRSSVTISHINLQGIHKHACAPARLGVLLRRPAPIITSFLGYPSTSGLVDDSLISDMWATPPEMQVRAVRCDSDCQLQLQLQLQVSHRVASSWL
jgi:hypothetical protein